MASVAEAVTEYDAWCEARGGACDFAEEAEAVDRLRRALDVALENAEHASSPLEALLDTARALLDDDPRHVTDAFPDETHEETHEVGSTRVRRALEAVGDHAVAGLVRVADLAGSPEAEVVACAALRAFARAAESPRDAFVAVLERLHIRAEQLRRGSRGDDDDDDDDVSRGASALRETESRGWRLAAECLRAMTSLLARWRRDPALHVLDAEPLVRRVEAIASLREESIPEDSTWASPAEALEAARAYRLGVLRLFASSLEDKNKGSDVSVNARVARLCLSFLARDPSPETLLAVSAATRARGVSDIESTFRVAGLEEHIDGNSSVSISSSSSSRDTCSGDSPLVGAVVLAGAWLVAAEEQSPFPEPFAATTTSPCRSAEAFFSARPERVAAPVAAAFAFADGDVHDPGCSRDGVRSALNAAAVHFAAVAFRRCGEGGARNVALEDATGESSETEKKTQMRRESFFARALFSLETRVASAPSPEFRELARLAHARLLTAVDHDTRFALIAARTKESETKTKASPAMRALYLSRLTRETHKALTDSSESESYGNDSPFADALKVVNVVLDATRGAIGNLEEDEDEDEDADALVAGLNFFRFVLGRAKFLADQTCADGETEADDARDVAGVWSRRAFVEAHVAAPAAWWARSTLARLDEGEGALSHAKTEETSDEDDESRWRRRMGAEHVLEAARFVSKLCENP